jgi:hypothetical protein
VFAHQSLDDAALRPAIEAIGTTTMVFGALLDVTLSELAIETFLPADA